VNFNSILLTFSMIHYRSLRIALKDYQYKFSRHQLLRKWKRASPTEWVFHCLSSIAIKTINNNEPYHLNQLLHGSLYVTRRKPSMGNFYDNSKGKVSKQKLNCKLKCIRKVKFDWLRLNINDNRLRILLKDTFFTLQNSHDEASR